MEFYWNFILLNLIFSFVTQFGFATNNHGTIKRVAEFNLQPSKNSPTNVQALKAVVEGAMVSSYVADKANNLDLKEANVTHSNASCRVAGIETNNVVSVSATKQNERFILTIGYSKFIQIISITFDHFDAEIRKCAGKEYLQKIAFDGQLGSVTTFKAYAEEHGVQRLHMVVSLKSDQGFGKVMLFGWIHSAFHETDVINIEKLDKVSVLSLETCASPLIFITKTFSSDDKTNSISIYKIDIFGKLKLQQILHLNYTFVEPFMQNCDYYSFLTCDENGTAKSCVIYKSVLKIIDFVEDRRVEIDGSKPRLVYTKNLVIGWDYKSQRLFFVDHHLRNILALNSTSNRAQGDLMDISLWNTEDNRIALVAVYKESEAFAMELSYIQPTRIPPVNGSQNSLENKIRQLQEFIYSHKIKLDKIFTLANQPANAMKLINLNKTFLEGGNLMNVNLNNGKMLLPSRIYENFTRLKETYRGQNGVTSKLISRLYVKKMHVNNLLYNQSLFSNLKSNQPSRLVLNSSNVLNVKKLHGRKLILSLKTNNSSPHIQQDSLKSLKIFQSVQIRNIILQKINGINYPQLYIDAFMKSRDTDIVGTLVMINQKNSSDSFYSGTLTAKYLNQYKVDDIFTLTSDQKVHSTIYVSKFLVSNISVNSLNGLKTTAITLVGEDNSLNSMVKMKDFTISGDLELSTDMEANIANHLRTARKLESFSQIYHGKVRIKGELILNNIYTTAKATRYSAGYRDAIEQIMPLVNFSQNFWMKSTPQKFNSVEFYMPIHLSSLKTESINDKSLSKFVLRNGNWKSSSLFYFNSVVIGGDFNTEFDIARANSEWFSIEHLQDNLIRRSSKTAELYGRVAFIQGIKVLNLLATNINSIVSEDLMRKDTNKNIEFTTLKRVGTLRVVDLFNVDKGINIDTYNTHNLTRFFDLASYANGIEIRAIKLNSLLFMREVLIVNVSTGFINQARIRVNDLKLDHDIMNDSRLLVFKGNVDFKQNLKCKTVNNLYWDDYLSQLKLKSDAKSYVGGTKYFLNSVKVSNILKFDSINNVNIKRLIMYSLQKSSTQTIVSSWKFHDLNIKNLKTVSKIDGINVNHLLGSNTNIKIYGNLKIMSVRSQGNVIGSIHDESPVDLALKKLRYINGTTWTEVFIRSQANWTEVNLNPLSDYELIQSYAMQSKLSQTIKGKVRFKTPPKFMVLTTYPLDGVNLTNIAIDYIGRKELMLPKIVVGGSKYFENLLSVHADIKTIKTTNVEAINTIDVLSLDLSIVRRESINFQLLSGGNSFFNVISTTHLITQGLVNSVLPAHLVYMNASFLTMAPPAVFSGSEIILHSFFLNYLNHMDFTEFLSKRIRIKGERQAIDGYLTFENLSTKKAIFSSINKCTLDRVVFKTSNHHQIISGKKTFLNPVYIIGPSSLVSVNDVDLIDIFRKTTFINQFYKLKKVEVIGSTRILFQHGLYISEDYPQEAFKLRSNNQILKNIFSATQRKSLVKLFSKISHRFLYMEFDKQINNISMDKTLKIEDPLGQEEDCSNHFKISYQRSDLHAMPSTVYFINDLNTTSSSLHAIFPEKNASWYFERNIKNNWQFSGKKPNVSYIMVEFAVDQENNILFSVFRVDNLSMNLTQIQEITMPGNTNPLLEPTLYKSSTDLLFFVAMAKLKVFRFDVDSETFKVSFSQERLWNRGGVVITNETVAPYQIILANRGDRKLLVYIANKATVYQIIHVPKPLERFVTFHDFQSKRSSLIIFTQDNFFLYMYSSNLEGWIPETNGVINHKSSVLCRYSLQEPSFWITSFLSHKSQVSLLISAKPYTQNGITND